MYPKATSLKLGQFSSPSPPPEEQMWLMSPRLFWATTASSLLASAEVALSLFYSDASIKPRDFPAPTFLPLSRLISNNF